MSNEVFEFLQSIEQRCSDAVRQMGHRYGHGRRSTILISAGHQTTT